MYENEKQYWGLLASLHLAEVREEKALKLQIEGGYEPPKSVAEIKRKYEDGDRFFALLELPESDFAGCNFENANFYRSDFRRCDFAGSSMINCLFSRCDLTEAIFEKAELERSTFLNAKCRNVSFVGANLTKIRLPKADCTDANFQNTTIREGMLTQAVLHNCNFSSLPYYSANSSDGESVGDESIKAFRNLMINKSYQPKNKQEEENIREQQEILGKYFEATDDTLASSRNRENVKILDTVLMESDFNGANLEEVDFNGSLLFKAKFENANLHNAKNILFDRSYVRNTKFAPNADDIWSILRKKYTGLNLLITTLFVALFFAPYIFKTVFYLLIAKGQGYPLFGNIREVHQVEWTEVSAWKMALGFEDLSLFSIILGIGLIVYNLNRVLLTLRIAPLREEEERSGYTPDSINLGLPIILNFWNKILGVLALGLLIYNIFLFLSATVYIPTLGPLNKTLPLSGGAQTVN